MISSINYLFLNDGTPYFAANESTLFHSEAYFQGVFRIFFRYDQPDCGGKHWAGVIRFVVGFYGAIWV